LLHAYDGHTPKPVCGAEGIARSAADKFPRTTYVGPMPPPQELICKICQTWERDHDPAFIAGRAVPSEKMRTVAREWLYSADHPNEAASTREVDDLANLLDEVRDRALQEAEAVCNREANACMHHAKAFQGTSPQKKMTLSVAHEMAGNQSTACGVYIRRLRAT